MFVLDRAWQCLSLPRDRGGGGGGEHGEGKGDGEVLSVLPRAHSGPALGHGHALVFPF